MAAGNAHAERRGYRGYVTSREFGGMRIPVPVQSLVLRDYCARKGILYKLHVNENMFRHSYLVLEGLVRDLSAVQGILMCSMFMLPHRAARRGRIIGAILKQRAELHLVLEDIVIRRPDDALVVEEVLSAAAQLPHCPARIPNELIAREW